MTEDFMPWMPMLVSAGVFFLLVMLASGIVAFAPKSVFEPFRRLADFAARRPLAAVIAAALLILGPVRNAVTKVTNGVAGVAPPPAMTMAMPPVPTVLPATVGPLEMNFLTNFPPVTNLCFWGMERGSNFVSLGIAWPFPLSFTNDFIDLYGNWRLASNGWARLLQIDVGEAVSNAVVDVPFGLFPTNAMEETAFFRLASQDDVDGDGLSDAYESWASGTDPAVADTDGDGLPDGDELSLGTDPFVADTDGDGLDDGEEINIGSNPLQLDTDGDGLSDDEEVDIGSSPIQPDTDGDGMDDGWEVENGLDPLSVAGDDGAAGDPDADGVENVSECRLGTDPQSADTDGDGLSDGEEASYCSSVAPAQMFSLHVLTNLTEALRSSSGGIVSCDLLVPVVVHGEAVTNITVDMRGIVYFNRPGYANPGIQHPSGRLDGSVMDGNCLTVSAYGGELTLSEGSSVCVYAAVMGGDAYEVVEYSNMCCGTNSISIMVATRIGDSDRVHVWYSDVLGDAVDGRDASV